LWPEPKPLLVIFVAIRIGLWVRRRRARPSVTKKHVQKTRGAIRIARPRIIGGLDGMGAKFRTTIKDLKASQRFRQKQNPLHKFNKPSGNQPTKKGEKK
jgi:hypothetical protein